MFFSGVRAPWKEKLSSQPPHTGVGRCTIERVWGDGADMPAPHRCFQLWGQSAFLLPKCSWLKGWEHRVRLPFLAPCGLSPPPSLASPSWGHSGPSTWTHGSTVPWACWLLRASLLPALPGEGIGTVAGPPLGVHSETQ